MIQTIDIQGIKMLSGKNEDINEHLLNLIQKEKVWITTVNALMFMQFIKQNEYSEYLRASTISIPDGAGIVKYLKKYGFPTERYPGIDLMEHFCSVASKDNYNIYLLGTRKEIVKNAKFKLESKHNCKVTGYHDGFFDLENCEEIIEDINKSGTDFLFVGMGIPKQERFIYNNLSKLNVKLVMGVGGSIDVFAGQMPRAPKIFQKLSLEWLFRMMEEPKRFKAIPELIKFELLINSKKYKLK